MRFLIFAMLLLEGCQFINPDPELFRLNQPQKNVETSKDFYCRKLSHTRLVEQLGDDLVRFSSGGKASFSTGAETQAHVEFYAEIERGDSAVFYFRTIPIEYSLTPAIELHLTSTGCRLEENGKLLVNVASIKSVHGKAQKIILETDGAYCRVAVDCQTIYFGKSTLPGTQFFVVEAQVGTQMKLSQFSHNFTIPINLEQNKLMLNQN